MTGKPLPLIQIVGAGPVGSLLALMLAKRGYQVHVLEKRPDLRTAAVPAGRSINLALAERGIFPLKRAGVFAQVEPLLIPMHGRMVHHLDGREEFVRYGLRPGERIYSVSRRDLNARLLSAAETTGTAAIEFNAEVTAIDLDRRLLTWHETASGASGHLPYSLVVGADGAASLLRDAIVRRSGGTLSVEMLDHAYKELAIPAGPNGAFQLAREALHIWPRGGFMLIALPNLDGSFTVTLFLPREGPGSFAELDGQPRSVRAFFQQHFPDALRHMPDLERDFLEHPTGELGTVRCWPWSFGATALVLGDAAHAIVPFHGQGMNAGFEDCAELIRMLESHGDDWAHVCREFPPIRKPNADAIAEMALENYLEMRDRVQREAFALRKELGFELERRFPDRFIPQYSMVMFHRLPYAEALRRGRIEQRILEEALAGATSLEQVDFEKVEAAIVRELEPI